MPRGYKIAVWILGIYQLVLTYCMLKLDDYAIWLHFSRPDNPHAGLTSTSPGTDVIYTLLGAVVAFVVGAVVAHRLGERQSVSDYDH